MHSHKERHIHQYNRINKQFRTTTYFYNKQLFQPYWGITDKTNGEIFKVYVMIWYTYTSWKDFQQMMPDYVISTCKILRWTPPTSYHNEKLTQRWIKSLHVTTKKSKNFRRQHGVKSLSLGFGRGFLGILKHQIHKQQRENIDKLYFTIKIKTSVLQRTL